MSKGIQGKERSELGFDDGASLLQHHDIYILLFFVVYIHFCYSYGFWQHDSMSTVVLIR